MKIINVQQKEDDWLAWRRQGITATDAAIILGRSPYKTRWRLWAEKTGFAREVDLSFNPLVRHGVENEDLARQRFEVTHNDLLLPVCVESEQYPLLRASLDGLRENGEPVEIKSPSQSVYEEVCLDGLNSQSYQLYYPQVQHQLLVTNAPKGWLMFYYEGKSKEFEIHRDEKMINDIILNAKIFWKEVLNKKEPDKDPIKDLYLPKGDEINQWITAAEEYRLYDEQIDSLKQKLVEIKSRQKASTEVMKSLMGEYYHADYCGVTVTRYNVTGKINYKQFLSEKKIDTDDIDQYRGKPTERYRITVSHSVLPKEIIDKETLKPLNGLSEEIDSFYW